MNDSILFLALATVFGLAMLVVGWLLREIRMEQEVDIEFRAWASRDNPNPVDSAGA